MMDNRHTKGKPANSLSAIKEEITPIIEPKAGVKKGDVADKHLLKQPRRVKKVE